MVPSPAYLAQRWGCSRLSIDGWEIDLMLIACGWGSILHPPKPLSTAGRHQNHEGSPLPQPTTCLFLCSPRNPPGQPPSSHPTLTSESLSRRVPGNCLKAV